MMYHNSSSIMMTSSNGNIFRVTGHLCGEFTGPHYDVILKFSPIPVIRSLRIAVHASPKTAVIYIYIYIYIFRGDHFISIWMTTKQNFHRLQIVIKIIRDMANTMAINGAWKITASYKIWCISDMSLMCYLQFIFKHCFSDSLKLGVKCHRHNIK